MRTPQNWLGEVTAPKFLGTVNYTGNKTYTNVLGKVTASKFLQTVNYTGNKTYTNVLGEVAPKFSVDVPCG